MKLIAEVPLATFVWMTLLFLVSWVMFFVVSLKTKAQTGVKISDSWAWVLGAIAAGMGFLINLVNTWTYFFR